MTVLMRTRGAQSGKWFFQLKDRLLLGRHPDCDTASLFAGVAGVSRHHAAIERVGGEFLLQDMGSRNGTFLNGQTLNGRAPLHDGDRIEICGVELTFCADREDAARSRSHTDEVPLVDDAAAAPRSLAVRAVAPPAPVAPAGYSAEKLRALAHMFKGLGRSIDVDETLRELLAGLFAIFPQAERGLVAFGEGAGTLTLRATRFRDADPDASQGLSRTLVNQVLTGREAVLWTDSLSGDGPPVGGLSMVALDIHSAMCAPLLDGDGQPFGLVQIDCGDIERAFTPDDLEVMSGAVSQAAVAVRFSRLHEEALKRQAIERDLQLAREVQFGLLPAECPSWPGYEFFAYYRSAHEVGGDYYDFVELPNNRLAVVVADVAGKGVSAALLMAKLSGELKYHLSCDSPQAAVARMNASLCDGTSGRFVTLLLAVIERAAHRLTLINAGHLTPLLRRRDGSVEAPGAAERGPALGLIPGRQYAEVQAAIEPGDAWYVFTDGFTEAVGPNEEMFGTARLRDLMVQDHKGVPQLGERLVGEVQRFQAGQAQSDDMCMVGWGRLAPDAPPAPPPPLDPRASVAPTQVPRGRP